MVSEIQADDEEMMEQLLKQGFLPLNTPIEKIGEQMQKISFQAPGSAPLAAATSALFCKNLLPPALVHCPREAPWVCLGDCVANI